MNTVSADRIAMASKPDPRPIRRVTHQSPRNEERKETWRKCSVLISDDYWIDAVIMDRSISGARVRFRGNEVLPPRVRVKCGALGMDQMMQLAWQNKGDAGLKRL